MIPSMSFYEGLLIFDSFDLWEPLEQHYKFECKLKVGCSVTPLHPLTHTHTQAHTLTLTHTQNV